MFQPKPEPTTNQKKGPKPDLSGDVQLVNEQDGKKTYTKIGHIALWNNNEKTSNQPDMRGTITPSIEGADSYAVSVWKPKVPAASGDSAIIRKHVSREAEQT